MQKSLYSFIKVTVEVVNLSYGWSGPKKLNPLAMLLYLPIVHKFDRGDHVKEKEPIVNNLFPVNATYGS